MITLQLPWPPSINHYYKPKKGKPGRKVIGPEGERFRKIVIMLVAQDHWPTVEGRLSLRLDCHPPDRRERDLDNILKALQDALQEARVYKKDSQIDRLHVERCKVDEKKRGYVLVALEEIKEV